MLAQSARAGLDLPIEKINYSQASRPGLTYDAPSEL